MRDGGHWDGDGGPVRAFASFPAMERKWWTLVAVCMGIFMLLLDITIVNVALPDIQKSLGSSFSDLQWVVDAYALTLAALLLTAGSLADLFGRRRAYATGIALFTLASLLCGLATSPLFLNLARGAQGIGGAMMFATSLALIAQEFQGRDRGTAFSAFGATVGFAVAIGPLLGGLITEGLGWEWIFFVNIPVGAALILVTLTRLAESRDPDASGVDWAGVVTFTAALFLLVFALIRGNAEGWGSPLIVGFLVGSVVLLIAFYRVERAQPRPMLDLTLFRKPAFTGASIAAFALSAAMFSMFLYLVLYLQNVLGYSPLEAGLRFLPLSLMSFLVAPVSGKLSARLPVRGFLGGGLVLVGIALLLMRGLNDGSDWTALLAGFLIGGCGIGLVNPPLASTAVGVVPPARSGMASGINTTFRQVGIATGIAGLGALFQSRVQDRATELFSHVPGISGRASDLAHLVASGGTSQVVGEAPPGARGAVMAAARDAFIHGLNEILLVAAIVAFVGAVLSFVLVRQSDFVVPAGEPAPAPVAA
jgi:EmrB/QacA subfamily drug resistance transporter